MKNYVENEDLSKSSLELGVKLRSKTLVAGVRYRPTTLANIVQFFELRGQQANSIGEALRTAFEALEQLIALELKDNTFTDPQEAIAFLSSRGLFQTDSPANYKARQIANLLSLSNLKTEREDREELRRLSKDMEQTPEFKLALKHLQGEDISKDLKDREVPEDEQDFSPDALRAAFSSPPPIAEQDDES